MIQELKKEIEAGNISFGRKQALKNPKKLDRVIVVSDCRNETIELLGKNKIEFEKIDLTKEEIANQLELDFVCEVFGLKK